MKITLESQGDRSVGIWPTTITIDWPQVDLDGEERKALREGLEEFWLGWLDGTPVGARFEDECPCCGATGYANNKCSSRSCVSNIPDEDGLIEQDCMRCEQTWNGPTIEEFCPACRRDPNRTNLRRVQ